MEYDLATDSNQPGNLFKPVSLARTRTAEGDYVLVGGWFRGAASGRGLRALATLSVRGGGLKGRGLSEH
jgi:hypothetical protein